MKKLILLAAAAAAFATSAVSGQDAAQQPERVHRSQSVSYSDIDVGTKKGAAELRRRVRVALESVCGTALSVDLVGRNIVRRCYRENKQRASAAISRATLASPVRIADKK